MKKTYKIEVDCANCAQKMEDAANTVAGVAQATVSFMTQKMKVEFAEGADPHDTMVNVLAACKRSRTTARSLISEETGVCNSGMAPLRGSFLWHIFWAERPKSRCGKLWKRKRVFNSFHRVFNSFCEKVQKETRKSRFSPGKVRGKLRGKRGKVYPVGKTC